MPGSDAALSRRAQILATEHWGLLAARGTAQSEVLTRITIFLTLVSAGLITIGLLGQASGFEGWFTPAMLTILGFLCVIGFLTVVRVMNVAEEDMMYVVAMNRLWAIVAGVLVGIALLGGLAWYAGTGYRGSWRRYIPRRTTPPGPPPFWRA